ncbi:MAG: aspartate aminotransferase [Candidatus Omnitrophica bacterium CG12_big_fil_rev_8_21_14_0_65_43_15]|uniref:Aminotransferase n=1 Tax=Candidatus Taenaricola geysiri TaxID=1974752 RepID=A0A2J0LE49_9BACT|nr:MAG: aspartate aminotransferase [Candidatus Omnitrophica bacterium CG12_big_fil_rev_8_21_14_0_65_43_15]
MDLSIRIKRIHPSATLGITARANKMKAEGIDVVSFGAGEPDFPTPQNVSKAGIEAIEKNFTRYTPSTGIVQLKEAIVDKFKKDNNLIYDMSQIVISCGAKHSLYNIFQAICNDNDEVIIPSPYWVSYPEMVVLGGAKPVIVNPDIKNGMKMTPEQLKKAINKKTRAVVINSPSNPTGVVYTGEELKELAKVIMDSEAAIISDEIYEELIYDGLKHISIASFGKDIFDRTFVVNGVSKSYSMTGWRIGYAAGPKDVMAAISNLQDHSTSNPTSISQMAALEALKGSQESVSVMCAEFAKRRDYLCQRFNKMKKLFYIKPQGAFYIFVDISKTGLKSMDFTKALLEDEHVAVIPGEPFGWDNYVRMSFATSMENITKGLDRIEKWLAKQ